MSEGRGTWTREALGIVLGEAVNGVLAEIRLVQTPAHTRRLLRALLRLSAEFALKVHVPLVVFIGVAIEAYQSEQADLVAHPEGWNGGGEA
jgi:hypothetical protein